MHTPPPQAPSKHNYYDFDGLKTRHNCDFLDQSYFIESFNYAQSVSGKQSDMYWRAYLGVSFAQAIQPRSINFVEFGVGDGLMSITIIRALQQSLGISPYFTFFDTFSGIDPSIISQSEADLWRNQYGSTVEDRISSYDYIINLDDLQKRINCASLMPHRHTYVPGSVPSTLSPSVISEVTSRGPVGFMHIDMNNATPEVAAIETFWPHMIIGGFVLLDDYGWFGYEYQKYSINNLCDSLGIMRPIQLPTGQGLLIKT